MVTITTRALAAAKVAADAAVPRRTSSLAIRRLEHPLIPPKPGISSKSLASPILGPPGRSSSLATRSASRAVASRAASQQAAILRASSPYLQPQLSLKATMALAEAARVGKAQPKKRPSSATQARVDAAGGRPERASAPSAQSRRAGLAPAQPSSALLAAAAAVAAEAPLSSSTPPNQGRALFAPPSPAKKPKASPMLDPARSRTRSKAAPTAPEAAPISSGTAQPRVSAKKATPGALATSHLPTVPKVTPQPAAKKSVVFQGSASPLPQPTAPAPVPVPEVASVVSSGSGDALPLPPTTAPLAAASTANTSASK
jgi:hypothetical protein